MVWFISLPDMVSVTPVGMIAEVGLPGSTLESDWTGQGLRNSSFINHFPTLKIPDIPRSFFIPRPSRSLSLFLLHAYAGDYGGNLRNPMRWGLRPIDKVLAFGIRVYPLTPSANRHPQPPDPNPQPRHWIPEARGARLCPLRASGNGGIQTARNRGTRGRRNVRNDSKNMTWNWKSMNVSAQNR